MAWVLRRPLLALGEAGTALRRSRSAAERALRRQLLRSVFRGELEFHPEVGNCFDCRGPGSSASCHRVTLTEAVTVSIASIGDAVRVVRGHAVAYADGTIAVQLWYAWDAQPGADVCFWCGSTDPGWEGYQCGQCGGS
jgi:hypothetical protein